MLEIIGLMLAVGGIAGFSRGRGASPAVTVSAALLGFLAIFLAGAFLASSEDGRFAAHLGAWAWVGAVALFVRFVVGSGRPSPTGMWICSNCRYTNDQHSNLCEACQQPWTPGP